LSDQFSGLWRENAEAYRIYTKLCGRTVRECHLEGWLLDRLTADWESERTLGLIERLNVILSVLEPLHGPTQD